jgi:hypothetical protein
MRYVILAILTAFTLGLAVPVLAPDRALAAPSSHSMRAMRTMMADMKAKDPAGYAACEQLARSRGYNINDQMMRDAYMFIEGCMSGKFR